MSRPKARSKIKIHRRVRRELRQMSKMKGKHGVKVGLPVGVGDYPDGTSVIDVGFWNEFGTKTAPERSWMRSSVRDHREDYVKFNRRNLLKIQQDTMTPEIAMSRLGEMAKKHMVLQIENFTTPPNAPSTIARKKAKNHEKGTPGPLEDTGHMKQAVTFEVMASV